MREYLANIYVALATCFEGLSVTFSHFFRRPYTVQYPDRIPIPVQNTLPYRYRGILEVDLQICTGCLACERACPIHCIVIDARKDKETKSIVLERFDIDMAKCMYCGLCSEPCPTGAIHHTREFEGADYSLESLVRRFVVEPVTAYRPKKSGEDDPAIVPILERGKRYIAEFAQPEAPAKPAKAGTATKQQAASGTARAGAAQARKPPAAPGPAGGADTGADPKREAGGAGSGPAKPAAGTGAGDRKEDRGD
ncbi:MAG: 4Fe-4S dicluster domain-containing protein [Candidatus Dadabacteria bacterium]|nr:MAG: 4Fe-4S dicluster domain-containing protein [Candidatus Dadabacteria bacterium]